MVGDRDRASQRFGQDVAVAQRADTPHPAPPAGSNELTGRDGSWKRFSCDQSGPKIASSSSHEKKVPLDVRLPDVDAQVRQQTLPAAHRQRLQAGHDQVLARDPQQLAIASTGRTRCSSTSDDSTTSKVSSANGSRAMFNVTAWSSRPELAPAVRQVHRVGEVGEVCPRAVTVAHQVRIPIESGADVDEAVELESIEPAEDLELAVHLLEHVRGQVLRPPLGDRTRAGSRPADLAMAAR